MGKQLGFYIRAGRCVQCHACEVACKVANQVELGPRWRRVPTCWSGQFPEVTCHSISISCMHCAAPACMAACPTGAIAKRAEDGIVVVDPSLCNGCRECARACPYGAPQFGADGKMQKCNLCLDRLLAGKEPACVATCPAEALGYGSLDDLLQAGQRLSGETQPSLAIGSSDGKISKNANNLDGRWV